MFSLAGADWPEDFALLEHTLREQLGLPAPPLVVNDALGALRAGAPDWTGVSVVSGTYNAIGARRPDGRVFHLGFWPDGAGGRAIGNAGLRAVYHAALGVGPATALTGSALALYEAADAIALLLRDAGRLWEVPGRALQLKPVGLLAWPAYRWIAGHRHLLPGGTAACSLPQAQRDKLYGTAAGQ